MLDLIYWLIWFLVILNCILVFVNFYVRINDKNYSLFLIKIKFFFIILDVIKKKRDIHLLCVIGSGGHTTEMFKLLIGLEQNYKKRTYVIGSTDKMGEKKVF